MEDDGLESLAGGAALMHVVWARVDGDAHERKEQCQVHAGEEDRARPGSTTSRRG